jgi:hypothetical protein
MVVTKHERCFRVEVVEVRKVPRVCYVSAEHVHEAMTKAEAGETLHEVDDPARAPATVRQFRGASANDGPGRYTGFVGWVFWSNAGTVPVDVTASTYDEAVRKGRRLANKAAKASAPHRPGTPSIRDVVLNKEPA